MDAETKNRIIKLSDKVSSYVKKITQEDNPSGIDMDLLLGHIRELYDQVIEQSVSLPAQEHQSQHTPTSREETVEESSAKTEKSQESDDFLQLRRNIEELKKQFDNFEKAKPAGQNVAAEAKEEPTASHREQPQPRQESDEKIQQSAEPKKSQTVKPADEAKQTPAARAKGKTASDNGESSDSANHVHKTLGESFNPSQSSVNDFLSMKKENNVTLGDQMKHHRVEDLKAAIDISHKFLFVNDLFGGNTSEYDDTIDRLNHVQSLQEAITIMQQKREKYDWDSKEGTFRIFNDLIHRKF